MTSSFATASGVPSRRTVPASKILPSSGIARAVKVKESGVEDAPVREVV